MFHAPMKSTFRFLDIYEEINGSSIGNITTAGGGIFFSANDGTTAGTERVADISNGSFRSDPRLMTPVGGMAYFDASDGIKGSKLWGFKVLNSIYLPAVMN